MTEAPATIPQPFHERKRFWIVAVLTLIGAIMRFWALDVPTLWGDEALTYSRVIGSWRDMFLIMRDDGFMPLNYILYWCQHQLRPLNASSMRLIPAFCGVAMIPTMYFLGRQIANVKTGLLCAAMACFSAYLFRYSHDAKMYMQTWLFVALNLAALLWWLNTDRKWACVLWIVSGLIAIGFSLLAALVIIVEPIIFLSARRHTIWRCLAFSLGMLSFAALPAWYFAHVSQWVQNADDNWGASGISWVDEFNNGSSGPMLLRESLSGYLVGYEWTDAHKDDDPYNRRNRRLYPIDPRIKSAFTHSYTAMIWLAMLGAVPWTLARKPDSHRTFEPALRYLWLGALLIVPVYGFYCRSFTEFAPPWKWLDGWMEFASAALWIGLIAALIVTAIHHRSFSARRAARFVGVTLALFVLACGVYFLMTAVHERHWQKVARETGMTVESVRKLSDLDWLSVWTPRYLGIIWPVVAVALAMLLLRLPTRPLRWSAIAFVLLVNLVSSMARMIVTIEPPHGALFSDVKAARDSKGQTRTLLATLDERHWRRSDFMQSSWFGVYGSAGKFYAVTILGIDCTPFEFRDGSVVGYYQSLLGELLNPPEIARVIASSRDGTLKRVIIWERSAEFAPKPGDYPSPDPIEQVMSRQWKLARPAQLFYQHNPNDWSNRGWLRRREYVRP